MRWGSVWSEETSLSLSYPYLLLSLIKDGQLKPFRATVWSIPCLDLPKESERKRGLYLWSHSFSVPGERAAIERFVLTFHAGLSSCFIALWHSVVWLWVMRGWRGTDERERSLGSLVLRRCRELHYGEKETNTRGGQFEERLVTSKHQASKHPLLWSKVPVCGCVT